jgi:exodeoxyribonuclease VII large subunit
MQHRDDAPSAARTAAPRTWSVQALLFAVADTLASRFGAVAVEGEIAAFTRAASGHTYFTLKDPEGNASLRCAMFRRAASMLAFAPRDGMQVVVRGRLSVYDARGELQLVVETMKPAGDGALYERFLRLKAMLEAQGLFDAARKRALPRSVACVGVITSLAAAALHDVLTALARRAPHVEVIVYPAAVQGPQAPAALVDALRAAGARAEADVLLLVRGGGSLEDLWSFNDERVVRAVIASPIPIVAGVGHESDVTLVDLAADLRAATPTAAAELAVPMRQVLVDALHAQAQRAARAFRRRLEQQTVRLDRAALAAGKPARVLESHHRRLTNLEARLPAALRRAFGAQRLRVHQLRSRVELAGSRRLAATRQVLDQQRSRVEIAGSRHLASARHLIAQQQSRIDALDPRRVLQRGYAWVTDEQGTPITSVARLAVGDVVQAVLRDGRIGARIESVAGASAPISKADPVQREE